MRNNSTNSYELASIHVNLVIFLALLNGLLVLSGCQIEGSTDNNPVNGGRQALAWTSTTPSQVDAGSGEAVFPLVVKEPDGGGTGLAVWIEQTDLDPFDILPPVYHLFARSFDGSAWATSDTGCPAGSGADDGICVIDTGDAEFGAWVPQVSMDDNGDAIVLWAQTDCLANPTGGSCRDYENGDRWVSNIYARRFSGGSWGAEESIDAGSNEAHSPGLAIEPDVVGGTAMAVWEQWDGAEWSIYARQLSGGSWATPCPGAGCPIIDSGVGPAHQPKVRMNNAGNAFAVFIQFANAICYTAPTGRTTPVISFSCPHNRLFYTTFNGASWAAPTDITPSTSLPSLLGCFDFLMTSCGGSCTPPGEAAGSMDCDCGCSTDGCNCSCTTTATGPINTSTCRVFSDCRLAMDRVNTSSATVVYKSTEWALVSDGAGAGCECDCGCSPNGCNCSCDCTVPDNDLTDTYQEIRIEAWRNTGAAGTTNNLANFSFLGPAGSTNCASINSSDGDDNRVILNCDFDSPTVAIVPDGAPAERIALYERYDGASYQIYYNRFSTGAWGPSTLLPGSADPSHAPQIIMDNAGGALGVWVQNDGTKWRIYNNSFSGGSWGVASILDNNVGSEDGYFNPVVAMDGPGSALALFIGFTEGFGFTLYGSTGP